MLSANEISMIRDDGIRKIIERRLEQHGIEIGRGKKPDKKKWKEALVNMKMPSGVPIKKVRVLRKEQTIQPIRQGKSSEAYVKPGSTHHLCIFEWDEKGKTKRDAVFVTMLQAINRVKNKQTIIQRTHPERPDAKFVMSLSRGEMVQANWKGREELLVLKTSISTNNRLIFARHTDARKSDEVQKMAFSPVGYGTLRKVTVDPLGRIRWAND